MKKQFHPCSYHVNTLKNFVKIYKLCLAFIPATTFAWQRTIHSTRQSVL